MANDTAPAGNALALIKQQIFAPEVTSQFRMALPSHIPVERFQRIGLTAVANNPDLLKADRRSLFNALGKCAQDGLLPDGREAALVIFNTKVKDADGRDQWVKAAQYMPMVAGVLKKVRNSGELAAISANVVYARDVFTMKLGDTEELIHEPPPLGEDRGAPVGAYAVATLKNGEKMREIMSKKDIEKVRAVSRSRDKGPWVDWWDEMARKTVIRRLAKRLPMSTDRDETIRRVIERDDEMTDVTASPAAPPQDAASAVQAALMAPAEVSEIDPETGEAPYQAAEQSSNDTPAESPGGAQPAPAHQAAMPGSAGGSMTDLNGGEAAPRFRWIALNGKEVTFATADQMVATLERQFANATAAQAKGARERNADIMAELSAAGFDDQMIRISAVLAKRAKEAA